MKQVTHVLLLIGVFTAQICLAASHPIRIDAQSNCLECHADHAAGGHVHPALKGGCSTCHTVEDRGDATYVTLKPTNSIVCRDCHAPVTVLHAHLPYTSAMCLRCHNPHSSANPRLLRAKVNDLCLECHLQGKTRANRYLPTIELTADRRMGHPYLHHPVSGRPDPLSGDEMSCLSCHQPHGGTQLHQLKMGAEIPEDALNQSTETKTMCEKCHMKLWGVEGASAKKKKSKH